MRAGERIYDECTYHFRVDRGRHTQRRLDRRCNRVSKGVAAPTVSASMASDRHSDGCGDGRLGLRGWLDGLYFKLTQHALVNRTKREHHVTMRSEIARARELRHTMSQPEVALWSRLKRLRTRGFHVRRQAPFSGYFLDFICVDRRVVIEVDGFQHADDRQSEHDFVRDRVLARHGLRVLRFWAGEVRYNLDAVMDQIVQVLEAAPSVRGGRSGGSSPDHTAPP